MTIQISALHVRRSAYIEASPARVWHEFDTFPRLAAWFGQGHTLERFEPRLDGQIWLSIDDEGRKKRFGGTILAFEPGSELSFSNNWESDGWPVPTILTIRLTGLYDGCLAELFHHGFERFGATAGAQLAGYEAGWHSRHLATLKAIVEGQPR